MCEERELLSFKPKCGRSNLKGESICCQICKEASSAYTCPKCRIKTCSLNCCKQHKLNSECDGTKKPVFSKIILQSDFTDELSFEDDRFLSSIRSNLSGDKKDIKNYFENDIVHQTNLNDSDGIATSAETNVATDNKSPLVTFENSIKIRVKLNNEERFLYNNSKLRRIWLILNSTYKSNFSHHEQVSNTIFWTVSLRFFKRKQNRSDLSISSNNDDKAISMLADHPFGLIDYPTSDESDEEDNANFAMDMEDKTVDFESSFDQYCEYTVKNIPESLRIITLLKQFLMPKMHGCVISKHELNLEKLNPFIKAFEFNFSNWNEKQLSENLFSSPSSVKIKTYLEIPDLKKYYLVDESSTLLENLRNRFVLGHPRLLIVLDDLSCSNSEMEVPLISVEEGKQFYETWNKTNTIKEMKSKINSGPQKNQRRCRRNTSGNNKAHNQIRDFAQKTYQRFSNSKPMQISRNLDRNQHRNRAAQHQHRHPFHQQQPAFCHHAFRRQQPSFNQQQPSFQQQRPALHQQQPAFQQQQPPTFLQYQQTSPQFVQYANLNGVWNNYNHNQTAGNNYR